MDEPDPIIIDSAPIRYMLSLPHGVESRESVPVLCFLHGYDEAAPLEISKGITRHGPLRKGSSRAAGDEFVVVAPQLPKAGDTWYKYAEDIFGIVAEVQFTYNGDKRRTYLTGFSFGGNGVFDLALIKRDFWAALWPVDPTRIPVTDPDRPLWLSFGEVSRRYKNAFIRSLGLTPGSASLEGDRIYLDQGEDHVGSATLAYRDDRIYAWLLSKQLPAGH